MLFAGRGCGVGKKMVRASAPLAARVALAQSGPAHRHQLVRGRSHAPKWIFPTHANGWRESISIGRRRLPLAAPHIRMSLLRAFFLWTVLVAVPFQGYAAATMAFCEPDHPAAAASGQHAGAEDHHASDDKAYAASHDDSMNADGRASDAGSAHKCGTCGACHAFGLASAAPVIPAPPLPQADLAEPLRLPASFSPLLLDRPPQA